MISLPTSNIMHELSVTENILEISLKHAEKSGATKITDVYLVIGDLATIIDDSVQFYWDIITENTIAQGAQLHFERLPVKMSCILCSEEFTPASEIYECPKCGGVQLKVISGEEFYLSAIDIEKKDILQNGVKNG